MSPVLTQPRAQSRPNDRTRSIAVGAGLVGAVVVVLVLLMTVMRGPHFVNSVTFTNPTASDVEVEVAGASGTGWLELGTVSARSTTTFESVVDEGSTWQVRYTANGGATAQESITSSSLRARTNRITMSDDVRSSLGAAGALATPAR